MNTLLTFLAIIGLAFMASAAPTHAPDAPAQFAGSFMQPGPIIRPFPGNYEQKTVMLLEIISQLVAKLEQCQNHTEAPQTTTESVITIPTRPITLKTNPSSEPPTTLPDPEHTEAPQITTESDMTLPITTADPAYTVGTEFM